MVVTSSRLHAVRYKQAHRHVHRREGLRRHAGARRLLGHGRSTTALEFTEPAMNGFPESQTADAVRRADDYQRADRRREVPDRLRPAAAAHDVRGQDARRARAPSRRCRGSTASTPRRPTRSSSTSATRPTTITEAFEPWYETTVAIPTDPNLLYDLADRLLALQVLDDAEAAGGRGAHRGPDEEGRRPRHGLRPARARRRAVQGEVTGRAGRGPGRARPVRPRLLVPVPGRRLRRRRPRGALPREPGPDRRCCPTDGGGRLDLGSEVELTHLRLEKTSEGDITPDHGVGELTAIYSGEGKQAEEETEHLSTIIEVLNERFGLQLGTADQLFFDQMEATWLGDEQLVAQARANPIENFRLVFADAFMKSIVGRMDDNEDIFRQILDDPAFQAVVMDHYLQRVFVRAHSKSTAKDM